MSLWRRSATGRKEPFAWRVEAAGHIVRHTDFEWQLLKVLPSVASRDNEWQVPAAAVIGLQNLTGCSQRIMGTRLPNTHDRS